MGRHIDRKSPVHSQRSMELTDTESSYLHRRMDMTDRSEKGWLLCWPLWAHFWQNMIIKNLWYLRTISQKKSLSRSVRHFLELAGHPETPGRAGTAEVEKQLMDHQADGFCLWSDEIMTGQTMVLTIACEPEPAILKAACRRKKMWQRSGQDPAKQEVRPECT